MIIGLVFLAMTAGAVLAVLVPLARRRTVTDGGEEAVYRDQLAEIERDSARGRIGPAEAEAARVEVARRLIAASDAGAAASTATVRPGGRRAVAVIALLVVPLVSVVIYVGLGRPDLPDQPLAARLSAPLENQPLEALIARVEAELAKRPDDGQGWDVLAPVYLRAGQPDKSAEAYRKAIDLLGATAEREAGLGEAMVFAAQGTIGPEAIAAFERARALDANEPRAGFYLAKAAEQDGDRAKAADLYRELLADAPSDAPYLSTVRSALAALALGEEGRAPAVDPKSLENVSPDQRVATIRGMVEGLAARLNTTPRDLGGQLRLIRAWTMLGEAGQAKTAAEKAREAFSDDPQALRRIADLLLGLGLEDKPA